MRIDGKRVTVDNVKKLTFSSGGDGAARKGGAGAAAGAGAGGRETAAALSAKLLRAVEAAARHRVVRGHALNAESSRSHAVLTLEVKILYSLYMLYTYTYTYNIVSFT